MSVPFEVFPGYVIAKGNRTRRKACSAFLITTRKYISVSGMRKAMLEFSYRIGDNMIICYRGASAELTEADVVQAESEIASARVVLTALDVIQPVTLQVLKLADPQNCECTPFLLLSLCISNSHPIP